MENSSWVLAEPGRLVYASKKNPYRKLKLTNSEDGAKFLKTNWKNIDFTESFGIVALNSSNQILGFTILTTGSADQVTVDVRGIFQYCFGLNATALILCHNHPSGNLKPSQTDIRITEKIKKASKFLDVALLDHIIITSESHYSFQDESML
jgi:DNA repair protein RadC